MQPIPAKLFVLQCLLTAGLSLTAIADAAESVRLNLQDALRLGLSNNYSIQLSELDQERADQDVRYQKGLFDPSFVLSASQSEWNEKQFREDGRSLLTSAGIRGSTPWGTLYQLNFALSSDDPGFADSGASIRITQPLLRNFGRDSNASALNLARNAKKSGEWVLRNTLMDTSWSIIRAYSQLFLSQEYLRIAELSHNNTARLVKETQRKADIGSIADSEVLTARSRLAQRANLVLRYRLRLFEDQNTLKALIARFHTEVLHWDIRVEPIQKPAFFEIDPLRDFQEALRLRPDFQQVLTQRDRTLIEENFYRDRTLPSLNLVGSFEQGGWGTDRQSSLDAFTDRPSSQYSIATELSIPIGNRSARSQYQAAKIQSQRSELLIESAQQRVFLSLDRAAKTLDITHQRILAAENSLEIAGKNLEAEEKKLQAGGSSTYQVLQIQQEYVDQQTALAQAIADYFVAIASYRRETGNLLLAHNIALVSEPDPKNEKTP